jgi:8-oxo-dGTP pyrophosphatase MutT (NUDIX family)
MSLRMRLLFAGAKVYWRIFQPLNFGVQLMLIRDEKIVLVRHSYKPGWYFPGGGVKKKETVEMAARREAMEEVGGTLGELHLFGIYANLHGPTSDHITVLRCHDFTLNGQSDAEIDEVKWFPLDQLPPDLNLGARRRIAAYQQGDHWPELADW